MGKYMPNVEPQFPEQFDYQYYCSICTEAAGLNHSAAFSHFTDEGKRLGLAGVPIADRTVFVDFLRRVGFSSILEIGPGVNPIMKGKGVFYFDVRQGDEFLHYAKEKGITDVESLPPINLYSKDGRLENIDQKFDLVFSSHCIEHTFDIVNHLNDVYELLCPNGVYCLIIPDKRYTFDYFKHITTVTDILYRHHSGICFHSMKTYLDVVYETHNDRFLHWKGDHGNFTIDRALIERRLEAFYTEEGRDPGLHAWIFTEESFRDVFSSLHSLGIIKLSLHRVYNVVKDSNSFCAVLKKD